MRPSRLAPAPARAALAVAAVFLAVSPPFLPAQERERSPQELLKSAREQQAGFEALRQGRIPVERERSNDGVCDERIGRICIWFGGEGEADFPPEAPEVGEARKRLIGHLLFVDERMDDAWITGQIVHYMVEDGGSGSAERVARQCGIPEEWWCRALLGYVLHVRGDWLGAEEAFREGLALMPAEERAQWLAPRYVLGRDAVRAVERLEPAARQGWFDLFWRLSDPLWQVEGNDRLTDHLARLVEARNQRDAAHPQGLEWEADLEETLVRYGRIVGYSRTHDPARAGGGGLRGFSLQDTRRTVGHHDPKSRGYLFPEAFLESPADVPPESWITAPREARTWYAPPYAPDFSALDSQVGRFRRGDEMLVVGAFQPAAPRPGGLSVPAWEGVAPFASADGVSTALFVQPLDGRDARMVWGDAPRDVLTIRVPNGEYVTSLEVFDQPGRRAWRARQGVKQGELAHGLVALSDLVLLSPDAAFPTTLEEAIPLVRPGVRVRRGERFTVAWEVYGLDVEQAGRVTIGFTRGRPGFLARVGDFLGVIEPDEPVEVSFDDPGADGIQSAFRAVALELPDLEPGDYTLHLRMTLPGREPVTASRPIVVVP